MTSAPTLSLRLGRLLGAGLLSLLLAVAGASAAGPEAVTGPTPSPDKWSHAYSAYGQPKYPRGFWHFD